MNISILTITISNPQPYLKISTLDVEKWTIIKFWEKSQNITSMKYHNWFEIILNFEVLNIPQAKMTPSRGIGSTCSYISDTKVVLSKSIF